MGGKKIASLLGSLCRSKAPSGSSDEASTSSNDGGDAKSSQASERKSLPLPPGRGQSDHHRAASFHQPERRSNSSASNLASSLSMRLIVGQSFRREGKKLEHEDSLWKKPIILGEKCRILDEDDDDAVLYDENGNRISTYHRRSTASLRSSPRRSSSNDEDEESPKKLGVGQN